MPTYQCFFLDENEKAVRTEVLGLAMTSAHTEKLGPL